MPSVHDLEVYCLGKAESVGKFNTGISYGAANVCMTYEKLHRAPVACLAINLRSLRPSRRLRSIAARIEPNRRHPFMHQPGILAGRHVRPLLETARKGEHRSPASQGC